MASPLPLAPFCQQIFAGGLLLAACWLLALAASQGPGEGLESLLLLLLLLLFAF